MAITNILIDGISGSGKTTVAEELERRGHHVIHGDRTLAYVGCTSLPHIEAPYNCLQEVVRQRRHGAKCWG